MNNDQALQANAGAPPDDSVSLAHIEQVIEQIGMRYIADLRMLNEELGGFYRKQLETKDRQIAALSRRLELAEEEHQALEAQIAELKRAGARYIAQLRSLSEELGQSMQSASQKTIEIREQGEKP